MKKIHLPKKPIAFLFSCFFVCYGMSNISDVQWIKLVMVAMGFYIEYEAQYLLGLSNAYKKTGKAYKWLLGVYLGYIIIFGLFSGIGFFATEISIQETASQKIETIEANNQERIKQLRALIDSKSQIQVQEYQDNNGVGPVYKQMQREIDSYNLEIKELLARSKTTVIIDKKAQAKDMFANLSKVTYIPKELLIIIMFGYALSIVYIALTIKPMEVDLESKNADKSEPISPIADAKGIVIGSEISRQEPVQTEKNQQEPAANDEQSKFVSYVNELYHGIDDSKIKSGPVELNGLLKVRKNLRGIVSDRKCQKYKETLNNWGAIVTNNGLNSLGMWPKADIINKIRGD